MSLLFVIMLSAPEHPLIAIVRWRTARVEDFGYRVPYPNFQPPPPLPASHLEVPDREHVRDKPDLSLISTEKYPISLQNSRRRVVLGSFLAQRFELSGKFTLIAVIT